MLVEVLLTGRMAHSLCFTAQTVCPTTMKGGVRWEGDGKVQAEGGWCGVHVVCGMEGGGEGLAQQCRKGTWRLWECGRSVRGRQCSCGAVVQVG